MTVLPVDGEAPSVSNDAVVVRLGDGRFAVGLSSIAEVGRPPALTRVPGTPGWLAGVVNWRGRILPVLDLRLPLGAPAVPFDSHARLVVLTADGVTVGLLVERVEGTASLAGATEALPSVLADAAADLLAGQVPREEGPIAVLDVAGVLRMRAGLPRPRGVA